VVGAAIAAIPTASDAKDKQEQKRIDSPVLEQAPS
jgi:hypothetical protein